MNSTVGIETITPAIASKWLENRFEGQRNVRSGHVQRLAATIQGGGWKVTGDAVTLIRGKLGNGQHRCEAIVLAGIPCEALVLRTTDEKLFDIMDSGIGRTISDVLGQAQIGSAVVVAAAARTALAYSRGLITRKKIGTPRSKPGSKINDCITREQVVQYSIENQEKLAKFAKLTSKLYQSGAVCAPSIAAAFLQIAHKVNEKRAMEYITTIYTGDADNAAADVRNRLLKNKLSNGKMEAAYIFAILIKGFKAYMKDERPAYYKIGDAEEFPTL